MAEVWEATLRGEAGFTRRVAIKRLFPEAGADDGFARRFLDEARIASRLHHANIVGIVDFGVDERGPFQVLEFVDGLDAGRLARLGREAGAPLPPGLALHVVATVGHALHFAHLATDELGRPMNVVHRDVSPQNVLLSRAGDVKLSDFGIALAEGRLEKTVGGGVPGKPAYMAPEQAIRGAVDARADVFALGCVLHALLCGSSPLADENALVDLLAGEALRLDASLPPEIAAVIDRAVRRDKAERFESAEAFALAAGALVPGFLKGDARTMLRDWVQAVAPPRETSDVVSPPDATPGDIAPRQLTPAVEARPRKSRAPAVVAVLAGVAAAGAFVVWPRSAVPVVAATPPPGPVEVQTVVPKTPDEGAPAKVDVAPPEPQVEPARAPSRPVRHASESPKPAAAKEASARAGVLAVGGESFLRGEVFIDGVSVGFAPRRFEVPVGEHAVEVRAPSGQRFGPKRLTVTAQHTELSPLSWVE